MTRLGYREEVEGLSFFGVTGFVMHVNHDGSDAEVFHERNGMMNERVYTKFVMCPAWQMQLYRNQLNSFLSVASEAIEKKRKGE